MADILWVPVQEPATCPHCGRRLDINSTPVGEDEDGQIFTGECPEHGPMLIQVDPEEDNDG